MFSMIFERGNVETDRFHHWIIWNFSFHEKDTESQRIVVENLSRYLLRKANITNILIGESSKKLSLAYLFIEYTLDDLSKCFDSNTISSSLLCVLVDQISLAIKECYHAAPDSLLNLLVTASNHANVRNNSYWYSLLSTRNLSFSQM